VYVVERFLCQLVSRKCRFHVAFFDTFEDICVPAGTGTSERGKFQLARAVVIRHLKHNLPVDSGILVKCFHSFKDPDFVRHVRENGVYFVMCHDGVPSTMAVGRNDFEGPRRRLRTMIIWFLRRLACNVALINEVEFKDTKVRTVRKSFAALCLTRSGYHPGSREHPFC
jgi:ATP-dependent RNA helicase DDX60